MNSVAKKKIGDIVTFKRGYDLPAAERSAGSYPVISSGGISGFHSEYKKDGEGIITGRYGTLGDVYYVNGKYWPHNTTLYSTNFHGNVPKYVYYLMKCLGNLKTSDKSTVPGINRNDLHELVVPYVEDRSTQQKISTVLSVIDRKIELNSTLNDNLEQMAKTLYDYWFVQFDFPDKNGKPYKSSGGKMVYDDALNREIPEEWEVRKLGELLHTVLGGTPSTKAKEYWNGDINWLNSGEVANFPIVSSELKITEGAIKKSATELLPKGSVLLSITRHLRPTVLAIDACANQSVIGIKENGDIKFYFLYPYLKNEIPRLMKLRTGAQQPHINKEIVDDSMIVVPHNVSGVLRAYNRNVESCYKSIINNSFQTQRLIELRDWLLPMLMNGQVKIG